MINWHTSCNYELTLNKYNSNMRTLSPFTRSIFDNFNQLLEENPPAKNQSHQLFLTPQGWAVRVDLPGFEKSDLTLQFEDSALLLNAQHNSEKANFRAPLAHRFALGKEVDTQSISAKLENGVLQIELPRREESQSGPQQINIQ